VVQTTHFGASADTAFAADLVIVGAGAAGAVLARECAFAPFSVLILESGVAEETEAYAALNRVESVGEPRSPAQIAKRRAGGFLAARSAGFRGALPRAGRLHRRLGGEVRGF
jgi:choline dehydrogenase-like flavoprotein